MIGEHRRRQRGSKTGGKRRKTKPPNRHLKKVKERIDNVGGSTKSREGRG